MKRLLNYILVLGVVGLMLISIPVSAENGKEIAQKVFPSVVLLSMTDDNNQPLSLGSGFFVEEDIVATNLHVIKNTYGGYVKIVGKDEKHIITGTVGIDAKHDLALIKVNNVSAPSLNLGNSENVTIGEEIYAVGNPMGLEGTFSEGIVSGIRKIEKEKLLQITAPISPGSSGGPILNSSSEVIGISVATFKNGQNLNFSIPSNYLKKLLNNKTKLKKITNTIKEKSMLEKFTDKKEKGLKKVSIKHELLHYTTGWEIKTTFSIYNPLQKRVKNILYLVIYYNKDNIPVDACQRRHFSVIDPGLASRIEVINGISGFSADELRNLKKEIRILNFEIVN